MSLPRSEHCVTLRWHWHLKGHLGIPGIYWSTSGGNSGRPDPASSSIMKSRKPDWRNGRAQQAVTKSRERQADLMVLLAGSLQIERIRFKGLGGYTFKTVDLWLEWKVSWSVWLFLLHCADGKAKRRQELRFQHGRQSKPDTGTRTEHKTLIKAEKQKANVRGERLEG